MGGVQGLFLALLDLPIESVDVEGKRTQSSRVREGFFSSSSVVLDWTVSKSGEDVKRGLGEEVGRWAGDMMHRR